MNFIFTYRSAWSNVSEKLDDGKYLEKLFSERGYNYREMQEYVTSRGQNYIIEHQIKEIGKYDSNSDIFSSFDSISTLIYLLAENEHLKIPIFKYGKYKNSILYPMVLVDDNLFAYLRIYEDTRYDVVIKPGRERIINGKSLSMFKLRNLVSPYDNHNQIWDKDKDFAHFDSKLSKTGNVGRKMLDTFLHLIDRYVTYNEKNLKSNYEMTELRKKIGEALRDRLLIVENAVFIKDYYKQTGKTEFSFGDIIEYFGEEDKPINFYSVSGSTIGDLRTDISKVNGAQEADMEKLKAERKGNLLFYNTLLFPLDKYATNLIRINIEPYIPYICINTFSLLSSDNIIKRTKIAQLYRNAIKIENYQVFGWALNDKLIDNMSFRKLFIGLSYLLKRKDYLLSTIPEYMNSQKLMLLSAINDNSISYHSSSYNNNLLVPLHYILQNKKIANESAGIYTLDNALRELYSAMLSGYYKFDMASILSISKSFPLTITEKRADIEKVNDIVNRIIGLEIKQIEEYSFSSDVIKNLKAKLIVLSSTNKHRYGILEFRSPRMFGVLDEQNNLLKIHLGIEDADINESKLCKNLKLTHNNYYMLVLNFKKIILDNIQVEKKTIQVEKTAG